MVYEGRAGMSNRTHHGGGVNYLCMPEDPEYTLPHRPGVRNHSYVLGTEYEGSPLQGTTHHNAPCAVCYVSTCETVLMIPAKTSCPTSWTREYYGYLMIMSSHRNGPRSTLNLNVLTRIRSLFLAVR